MASPKSILITGASRGIGLAIAKYLLRINHNVFLVSRTGQPMAALKEEFPGQVEYFIGDLADFKVGPEAVSRALTAFKKIDTLILNHGTLEPIKRIADSTPEEWRASFDVNFFSLLSFIKPAISSLRQSQGAIILTSSGAATGAYATWGSYGSSKAAINHLALTLAVEEPLITTLAIRPGVVDTDMQALIRSKNSVMDGKDAEKFKRLYESGSLVKPEDVGGVMARIAVRLDEEGRGMSGKFLSWDSEDLKNFRDA